MCVYVHQAERKTAFLPSTKVKLSTSLSLKGIILIKTLLRRNFKAHKDLIINLFKNFQPFPTPVPRT